MEQPFTVESWAVLDGWPTASNVEPQDRSWEAIDELQLFHGQLLERKTSELDRLLREWDRLLHGLGGDPTHEDWKTFRPLRLKREEDWSDWLAHLLARSSTGVLAYTLFGKDGREASDFARPKVEREVSHEGYRADLIVHWQIGLLTHVEVKVGDQALEKTFGTAEKMMAKYGSATERWTHFVLLLSPQVASWTEVADVSMSEITVEVVTWDEVCVAIRRALVESEPMTWKSWAWAYLGTIEQVLIGYDQAFPLSMSGAALESKVDILKRGLGDDRQAS